MTIQGLDYAAIEAQEQRMLNGHHGLALPPGQDEPGVYPIFSVVDVQNAEKSQEAGRPICEQVEFVQMQTAGSGDLTPAQRVDGEVKRRFPQAYARWKAGLQDNDMPPGTPLTAYPPLHSTRAKELALMGIKTVEQLIEIPDAMTHRFGPDIQGLQARAKTWLQAAQDASVIEKLHAKADEQTQLLKNALDRIELLEAELRDAGVTPKTRKGRLQDGKE